MCDLCDCCCRDKRLDEASNFMNGEGDKWLCVILIKLVVSVSIWCARVLQGRRQDFVKGG